LFLILSAIYTRPVIPAIVIKLVLSLQTKRLRTGNIILAIDS
jgi:hypothetical protein